MAHTLVYTAAATPTSQSRSGFTLIEVVLSLTLLVGVVLGMSMGTTAFQRSIGDANIRSRAQARADLQMSMARVWPTWSTLENLTGAAYNSTADGLTTTTAVVADTLSGKRIKRVTVTVNAYPTSAMLVPVKRMVSLASP